VRSRDYRLYLNAEYRKRHGRVPTGQALTEGIEAIEAHARKAHEHEAFVRVAAVDDKVYLDLANEAWTVVEIDAAGWRVITRSPVYFVRPRGLRALPDPQPCNGIHGIAKLQALVNLRGDDFIIYVSWIVACLQGLGSYPILMLSGEHGTAKTSAVRIAVDLVDPGKITVSGPPRSEEDLAIAASKRHVLAYDNLSKILDRLADSLCRLSTGGGLQKRSLYTNDEQHLIVVRRPIVLTGIPDLTSRADLADRAIVAVLQPIPEGARLTEKELSAKFEDSRAEILGAVLNGVSLALRDRARQAEAMKQKPRMTDFAVWAAAAAPAFGWTADDFLQAYTRNREEAVERVLEADPVADAVIDFTGQAAIWKPAEFRDGSVDWARHVWKNPATALLRELGNLVPDDTRRERSWPKDGTHLSERLRRLAPALRTKGIMVDFGRARVELPDGGNGKVRRFVSITVRTEDVV
jgi:putative DNA primase/helicase